MATVTKRELVDRIAERLDRKHVVAKSIIQYFLDEMVQELCGGNRLEFRDFGVFSIQRMPGELAGIPGPARPSTFQPGRP